MCPKPTPLASLHGVIRPARFAALVGLLVIPSLGLAAPYLPAPLFALPALGFSLAALLAFLTVESPTALALFSTPWPTALAVVLTAAGALATTALPQPLAPMALPVAIGLTAMALRHTHHSWAHTNQMVLTLLLSLPFTLIGVQGQLFPAAGLLALVLTLLLGQPRLGNIAQIALATGLTLLATSTPWLTPLPLLVALGLAAVWPHRALALVFMAMAALLAQVAHAPAPLQALAATLASPLAPLALQENSTQLAAALLLTIVSLQLLYHWRWWPPALHAAWGLMAFVAAPTLAAFALPAAASAPLASLLAPLSLALPLGVYCLLKPDFKK